MEDEEMEDEQERTPSGTGILDFSNSASMEEDRLDREAAGAKKGMLDFSNSPSMEMSQLDREIKETKQAKVHEDYQKEMENIKKFGPLDRTSEAVMSGEEQEISTLFDEGNFEEVKNVLRSKVESLGGDYEDHQVIENFNKYLACDDPVIRERVLQLSVLYTKLVKDYLNR